MRPTVYNLTLSGIYRTFLHEDFLVITLTLLDLYLRSKSKNPQHTIAVAFLTTSFFSTGMQIHEQTKAFSQRMANITFATFHKQQKFFL